MENILETKRLILRPWLESDAESLYKYAKDPDIGIPAGWPPHKSVEESLEIIKTVLMGKESYAICEKGTNEVIGAIALKLNGNTDMTGRNDECELGYWLGKPFWGRGYMPEAARELLRHGFEELGIPTVSATPSSGTNLGSVVITVMPAALCGISSLARSRLYASVIFGRTSSCIKRVIKVDLPLRTGPTTPI